MKAMFAATVLVCALFSSSPVFAQGNPVKGPPQLQKTMRQYYVTRDYYDGSEAINACAPGFHMASIWEILDPSNLSYNSELGDWSQFDGGEGQPPAYIWIGAVFPAGGWIRTGYLRSYSADPGMANCFGWTTNAVTIDLDNSPNVPPVITITPKGSTAHLRWEWDGEPSPFEAWEVSATECHLSRPVWCVEDIE